MNLTVRLIVLSGVFALATAALGWWSVPVVGLVWGGAARAIPRPALVAAVAAGLGWAWLLLWTAFAGPAGELARRAAGVVAVPSLVFVLVTVAFPMILAWGAAVLGALGTKAVSRDPRPLQS